MGMTKKKRKDVYTFKDVTRNAATSVKSQGSTGTCWIYATISFLESEVLRKGGEEVDLSEMYVSRLAYTDKARQFVYMHGSANFGQGGQAHDVTDQMKKNGIVPEIAYPGKLKGQKKHNHGEVATVLQSMLDGIIKRRGRKLTPVWKQAFEAVLDVYFGKIPDRFEYKGKEYTPQTFMSDYLKLDPNDYIELTSYLHHPFYKKCRLEVPDNWTYNSDYYNIPMNDMVKLAYDALNKGYTFCWDADVSESYYSKNRMDVSLVPLKDDRDKSKKERAAGITKPVKEKTITCEMRQETFDNWTTTDDHLMHIVGIAKDQSGKKFFIMKNSWGINRKYKGYFYVSEAYFRLKTINIMIHKDSLSKDLKAKLNL
jgi:bleomycin hydrolase